MFHWYQLLHLLKNCLFFRITKYSRNLWTATSVARISPLSTHVVDITSFVAKSAMLKCLSGRIHSWGKLSKIDIFMDYLYINYYLCLNVYWQIFFNMRLKNDENFELYISFMQLRWYHFRKLFRSNANISLRKFILLIYCFVSNFWTYDQISKETDLTTSEEDSDDEEGKSQSSVLSRKTISSYFSYFR